MLARERRALGLKVLREGREIPEKKA